VAGEILQGFGHQDREHFKLKAARLGYDVEEVIDPGPSDALSDQRLYVVTQGGASVSSPLTNVEVHDWLNQHEAQAP
jgi:hypothetical protein